MLRYQEEKIFRVINKQRKSGCFTMYFHMNSGLIEVFDHYVYNLICYDLMVNSWDLNGDADYDG
jgi:hypothetical protein